MTISNNLIDWHTDPLTQFRAFEAELGLTPKETARAMGVSYETYRQWPTGKRKIDNCALRCIELLLKYPRTAKKLAKEW